MSKIRDAMRKAEREHRGVSPVPDPEPAPREPRSPEPPPREDGGKRRRVRGRAHLSVVPPLSSETLGYYEAIGKQIEVALGEKTSRTLVFTAAVGGDGISTVIAHYAEMLSRRGSRVLLIDGNP